MSEKIPSFMKKIAKMGDKRVIMIPLELYDFFKPGDTVKVIKIEGEKNAK